MYTIIRRPVDVAGNPLKPGDVVQIEDRKSGYSGCVLDFIRAEKGARTIWYICRNDSYPTFQTADEDGKPVGAVRVRGVKFMRHRALVGRVTGTHGSNVVVECDNAPRHLSTLYLTPLQARGARVGECVTLQYQTGPSYGEWVVVDAGTLQPRPLTP